MSLSLGKLEKLNLQSDLETLQFAEKQVKDMTEIMEGMAAEQEEIGRLLHDDWDESVAFCPIEFLHQVLFGHGLIVTPIFRR